MATNQKGGLTFCIRPSYRILPKYYYCGFMIGIYMKKFIYDLK
jgi:hypothetical protein